MTSKKKEKHIKCDRTVAFVKFDQRYLNFVFVLYVFYQIDGYFLDSFLVAQTHLL